MAAEAPETIPAPAPFPENGRRVILYLIEDRRNEVGDDAIESLRALRPWATEIVAVVRAGTDAAGADRLSTVADAIVVHSGPSMDMLAFTTAIREARISIERADEVVFTGNSWYGPVRDLAPVFERMDARALHAWQMTGNVDGRPETFPEEGFPGRVFSWLWLAVRGEAVRSRRWAELWPTSLVPQHEFAAALESAGYRTGEAFPAADYPRGDPALFAPDLLIEDGFPFLSKAVFAQYPPFLDRHAVLGRELLEVVDGYDFPVAGILKDLARNVPPKALNSIGGMLEVLPDVSLGYDASKPFRIGVIAYVPDVAFISELKERLVSLPSGFDLVVTTGDGGRARAIERALTAWQDAPFARFETRVSWVRRGRDKAALFIACRDLILGDDYDLLVAVHGRVSPRKTDNMQYYSRRHQLDNLLGSPGYVENLLGLFQREPGLGLVFPPMVHIGNAIVGRGWGAYREPALALCRRLGVKVPLDRVTPLAPFGGMWVGRPDALRPLARERWSDNDYGRQGRRTHVELGRVQERLIPLVAAEQGYHCRTVLNSEHAAISHTSLEYKADQMFSTTRGYPVEQIRFLHRLGFTGHGGVVALTRMYLRLNHPKLARATAPLYRVLFRTFTISQRIRQGLARLINDYGAGA
ncbi:rhamnan synthesis F family protein [Microbacterium ureisolvens]|uniref:rhamnan synthesis F family protein n=1 Tax=Microbacterium ureisolvens TaxID=2781186 RepID=UPI003625B183